MQKENLEELLSRGVEEIIVKSEVEKALKSGKQIRIYYGVDPSGPVIHLGHAVILRKLSKLQEMGHKIIFLIGDFTGMIGDPTDREAVRVPLTREQVLENAKTYKKQIAKFLNLSGKNAAEIRFNSEWNDKLSFKGVIELASRFTVQQLLERDMFQKRMAAKKPISLQEFMYPIVQGYDAVMLDADMQVGGTDQLFNMLQGRQLMKSLKNKNQTVMTFTLLEGTDGRKMSKSFNNVIAIEDEPNDMYGKVMSVKDELILQYFELATDVPMAEVKKIAKELESGKNPRDLKAKLAFEIVKLYHGEKAAEKAAENFQKTVVNKEVPTDIPAVDLLKKPMILADILVNNELAPSKSEARRLIEQGGVKVDGTAITDRGAEVTPYTGMVIQAGKRKFIKVK
jgi:tyrosyl-tRNA synthetase